MSENISFKIICYHELKWQLRPKPVKFEIHRALTKHYFVIWLPKVVIRVLIRYDLGVCVRKMMETLEEMRVNKGKAKARLSSVVLIMIIIIVVTVRVPEN